MKTLFFTLINLFLLANLAQAETAPAPVKEINGPEKAIEEEFILDLDQPFWFQEKVYIHIYDSEEKAIIDGAYSKEALSSNQQLRELLRKSTRFLSIDNHHYYYLQPKAE